MEHPVVELLQPEGELARKDDGAVVLLRYLHAELLRGLHDIRARPHPVARRKAEPAGEVFVLPERVLHRPLKGLKLLSVRDRKHRPRTDQEYLQANKEIHSKELENLKEKLRGRGRPQSLARKRQRTGK